MLIEVGHFALVLSLIISVLLIVVPSIGLYQNKTSLAQLARPLVWAQGFWIASAFFVLMGAFLSNDFSVKYVADNSNTQLPLLFKASAVWGLSLIHISEPTRRTPISYAVFCLKKI